MCGTGRSSRISLNPMSEHNPLRWLPPGLDVTVTRYGLGRVSPRLARVTDPGALIDSVDAGAFGPDERFPYWSEVWPSSIALGRFFAGGKSLAGTGAVELGCGLGLAGVTAALRGADVIFSDYDPHAIAFARVNHFLNLRKPGRTRLFDWREPPGGLSAGLVIASDVLYEKRFVEPFLKTVERILLPGGRAVVAEPGRKVAEGSLETLEEKGYRRSLSLEEFEFNGRPQAVWIHTLSKPVKR